MIVAPKYHGRMVDKQLDQPAQPRVRAPRLTGRGWINTAGGAPPDLAGRIVLLDFWKSSTMH
jgi:hypothetical protein